MRASSIAGALLAFVLSATIVEGQARCAVNERIDDREGSTTRCVPCPNGSTSLGTETYCDTNCAVNTEPIYTGVPYSPEEEVTCTPCRANRYSEGGSSKCSLIFCAPGSGIAVEGEPLPENPSDADCNECPAGTYAPSSRYLAFESALCLKCAGSVEAGFCRPCPRGTYFTGDSQCTTCPAGTTTAMTGSTSIDACVVSPCDTGSGLLAGSSTCVSCKDNYGTLDQYSYIQRSYLTPDGEYYERLDIPTEYEDGRPTEFKAAPGFCISCGLGSVPNADYSACEPCPANTYQVDFGSTSCMACPAGTSSRRGSVLSESCQAIFGRCYDGGYLYTPATGSQPASCESCPPGTVLSGEFPGTCNACPFGTRLVE